MLKQNNHDKELDNRISQLIRTESPAPYADEWFTRKTVNRLPPQRERLVSVPEVIAFLLVLAVSTIVAICEMREALSLPDPSTFKPDLLLGAIATAIIATLYISVPILRKCL